MKYNRILLYLLGLMLSLLMLTGCGGAVSAPVQDSDALFYTADAAGQRILGYEKEENQWYLFVPSATDIPSLTLSCREPVASLSAGTLEGQNRITGAFRESGNQVTVTTDSGDHIVTVLQSRLPSVQLQLDDGNLDTIHNNKDTRVRISHFSLTEPGGARDLEVGSGAEIKGRGNTSWSLYDKKGYQIRFDVKTSVLGMERAKKWVLLANSGDDSLMRAKLVHDLARKMDMGYVPQLEHVDLWIDGEYQGTYLMGEKAEIGTGRLNLHSSTGTLFEHDENYFAEEDYWFVDNTMRRHFTIKEIAVEQRAVMEAAEEAFNEKLDSLMYYLYTTLPRDVTLARLAQDIDVDSFAKYYLINEYVLNCESFATSFFWYQDGWSDVLHLGPVWDFDTCMGNDGMTPEGSYGQQHLMFTYLLAAPAFRERTEQIYRQYEGNFAAMAEEAALLEARIESSARMNYIRWEMLGKPNPKPHSEPFHETFAEAVKAVSDWLQTRRGLFTIPACQVVNSVVSEDCRTMDLYYEDGQPHEALVFAVWRYYSEGENRVWLEAQETDGVWHAQVDMTRVNEEGLFRIDVLETGHDGSLASGSNVVKKAVPQDYVVEAYLTEGGSRLTIDMQDNLKNCQGVSFAVWGEENDQDDRVWLEATQNAEGLWTVTVDTASMTEEGIYHVHAWGNRGLAEYEYLEGVTFRRSYPGKATVSEDGRVLSFSLDDYNVSKAVSFAVWSLAGNQEDIVWIDAVRNAEGIWECEVELNRFRNDAPLAVHAFGNITGRDYRFLKELIVELP